MLVQCKAILENNSRSMEQQRHIHLQLVFSIRYLQLNKNFDFHYLLGNVSILSQ